MSSWVVPVLPPPVPLTTASITHWPREPSTYVTPAPAPAPAPAPVPVPAVVSLPVANVGTVDSSTGEERVVKVTEEVDVSQNCSSVPLVYPPFPTQQQKQRVVPFGSVGIPIAFAAPDRVSLGAITFTMPRQLPPPYIVFGGARYDHVPPPRKTRKVADSNGTCERTDVVRRTNLEHISEQLKLASTYLHLNPSRQPLQSSSQEEELRNDVDVKTLVTPSYSEEGVFSSKNIWTVAYSKSVKVLHDFIKDLDRDAINAKGYVLYNRRHYGIKKCGEKFVLGLGQKATPLQFAAVAGHLDSVVLLLHCGSQDDSAPHLIEILGDDVMKVIKSLRPGNRMKRETHRSRSQVEHTAKTATLIQLKAEEIVPPTIV
ncbi:calphotin-like protein [Trypanosoma theileri]|uniref:Calphotin-like protein n=1 Tax=Trypanosoma theileri TaxID=67003 RepID=A0A1X0NL62_9TRYP|nr:calphotin-like protein [Trypanosoma theileri]ORC85512.1 calphotin-like protein [Trypanosoma theileri]